MMKRRPNPATARALPPPRLEVWVDGSCPLCLASRAWFEKRAPDGSIVFRDQQSCLPVELGDRARSDQVWARDRRGRLRGGYAAWLELLAVLPGWRVVARVAALPPFSWVGPSFYRLVAARRRRLPLTAATRRPGPARPA